MINNIIIHYIIWYNCWAQDSFFGLAFHRCFLWDLLKRFN